MARCPWTGREFPDIKRGAHPKVFADDRARAEAHKAARMFTEHLIRTGFLSWAALAEWYRGGQGPLKVFAPAVYDGPSVEKPLEAPKVAAE